MTADSDTPAERVRRAVPPDALDLLDRALPAADLRTVLLGTARARAVAVTPADVLRRWTQDRFVRPAPSDPRAVAAVEARIWALLPPELDGVDLSPVAPLGSVSAVTGTSQDRIVTTTRLTEVVSDSTNALAVEVARRRLDAGVRRSGPTHLATCQRQLRAQDFGPGAQSHFRLFCLVSSARDRGGRRAEADLLVTQLTAWARVLSALVPHARPRVAVTLFDDPVLVGRWHDSVLPALAGSGLAVAEDPGRRQGRGYYRGLALKLFATDADGADLELGDGGVTGWTAALLGDAKERCLVSCLATERLALLV